MISPAVSLTADEVPTESMTATATLPYQRIKLDDDPFVAAIDVFETPPGAARAKPDYAYLSPSQITQYHRCAAAYFFKYHESFRLREPQNSKLTFGSGWHGASHVFLHHRELPISERAQLALDAGKALMRDLNTEVWTPTYDRSTTLDSIESLDADLERAIELSIPYWERVVPVAVERGWTIHWRGDRHVLPLHGFCDLIDGVNPNAHALIDLKSSSRMKTAQDIRFSVAQTFYAAAHSRVSAIPVEKSAWWIFKKTKVRDFTILEGPDFPPMPAVSRLYRICVAMTEALAHGIYAPIPDAQGCGSCSFRGHCDEMFGT